MAKNKLKNMKQIKISEIRKQNNRDTDGVVLIYTMVNKIDNTEIDSFFLEISGNVSRTWENQKIEHNTLQKLQSKKPLIRTIIEKAFSGIIKDTIQKYQDNSQPFPKEKLAFVVLCGTDSSGAYLKEKAKGDILIGSNFGWQEIKRYAGLWDNGWDWDIGSPRK